MVHLVVLIMELWRARYRLLLPMLVLPAVAVAWSMGNTPIYQATTTLSLERAKVHSPLLQNIDSQENQEILRRFVHNLALLEDTLLETGDLLPTMDEKQRTAASVDMSSRLGLKVLDDNRIQLNYEGADGQGVVQTLEKLSRNFVDEILAPERLRVEQVLFALSEQIRYYGELERVAQDALEKSQAAVKAGLDDPEYAKGIVRLEFDVQRSKAQRQLAQKEYDQLFAKAKILRSSMNSMDGNSILSFVESPTLIGAVYDRAYHISVAKLWLWIGFLLGTCWLILGRLVDSSLRREDDIHNFLGVKVLGRIPTLGNVQTEGGRLNIVRRS